MLKQVAHRRDCLILVSVLSKAPQDCVQHAVGLFPADVLEDDRNRMLFSRLERRIDGGFPHERIGRCKQFRDDGEDSGPGLSQRDEGCGLCFR